MIIINYINYGEMRIAIEGHTKDNKNYNVVVTDVTPYKDLDLKKANRTIASLNFTADDPDSLKIIKSSKDYSPNMRANIIKTALNSTFTNININQTSKSLTTTTEQANALTLRKRMPDFKMYVPSEKVIIA